MGTYGGGFPFVLEASTVDALEAHARHAAGGDVESGRDGYEVEFVVVAVGRFDTRLGELLDAVAGPMGYVYDVHGVPIELLKVVLLETRALDSKGKRGLKRAKKLSFAWVVHPCAYLLDPEVVYVSVCLHVVEIIFIVPEPE